VLAFLGPSGSGKSSVVRALSQAGAVDVTPTWTTRPRRPDEQAGAVEHHFASEEEFNAREQAGFFLEVVRLFGLSYRYGLPAVASPDDGPAAAIMVRAPLAPLLDRHFPDAVVYQIEDSYERARARVLARTPPAELGTRLDDHEQERLLGRRLATRVFVNDTTVADLVASVTRAIDEDFASGRER